METSVNENWRDHWYRLVWKVTTTAGSIATLVESQLIAEMNHDQPKIENQEIESFKIPALPSPNVELKAKQDLFDSCGWDIIRSHEESCHGRSKESG
ncbi:hypothetical protein CRE_29122 [Caenorhabditis remanei]|uniref:Uncharacterized protein n=1 Tax=Caenorhabditis remanei TaxID=31234 RepID=E3N4M8_CAERE|nr:hypothetical protein CRE_29122 [Caenorhabditis remanei]